MTAGIFGFKGPNRPFSNFWFAQFEIDGVTFEHVEQYFVYHKTIVPEQRAKILTISDPGSVKSFGRKSVTLRDGWDDMRDEVMLWGVRAKFSQNVHLGDLLRSTGKAYLEETNTWGDRYWGVDGTGLNMLGLTLMRVRAELQHWGQG